jgi:hypothetical protein
MLCEQLSLQVAVVTGGDMVSSRHRRDLIKVLQYSTKNTTAGNKFMFLDNLAVVLGFLTLQDKHNIQCRKIYNSFTLAWKNGRKANYIFRQCTYIVN